eukprot:jgi/Botrbrau1/22782/Bobra.0132s0108.1
MVDKVNVCDNEGACKEWLLKYDGLVMCQLNIGIWRWGGKSFVLLLVPYAQGKSLNQVLASTGYIQPHCGPETCYACSSVCHFCLELLDTTLLQFHLLCVCVCACGIFFLGKGRGGRGQCHLCHLNRKGYFWQELFAGTGRPECKAATLLGLLVVVVPILRALGITAAVLYACASS